MKIKLDLSKFKLGKKDDKIAVLHHPDGHTVHIAIKALNPMNRKNLDAMEMNSGAASQSMPMADGGKVRKKKLEVEEVSPPEPRDPVEYESIPQPKPKHPVEYEAMADGGEAGEEQAKVCMNPECGSHGSEHPNCECYANGGCISEHSKDCPMYAEGEEIMPAATQSMEDNPEQIAQDAAMQAPQPAQPMMSSQEEAQLGQQPPIQEEAAKDQGQPVPTAMQSYKTQEEALKGIGQAEAGEQQAIAQNAKAKAGALQEINNNYGIKQKELMDEGAAIRDDIKKFKFDPNRVLGHMSTGKKIETGISLFLGGLGAGLAGGSNPALDFINKQIDRDIDMQKEQLGKKHTLLSANHDAINNLDHAANMTRLQMNDMYLAKAEEAAAKAQSPLAKQRANLLIGQLQQQMAPMAQKEIMRRMLTEPNAEQQIQPAQQIRLMKDSGLLDEEQYKTANKELERAQNVKMTGDDALKNYDAIVAKQQSFGNLGRLGTALYEPAEQGALAAELGSTVGDMEGSVREQAMNNVKNAYLPKATDSPARAATKREELAKYLQLKSAAPVAESYGIKLPKSSSTQPTKEIERIAPDGKVGIFDAGTKKFLRYK